MKKRLSIMMAIAVVVGMVFMAGPVMADVPDDNDTIINGTVPFCANWTLIEPDVASFTSVTAAMYEANEFIVTDLIQITDFDCNTKFKITATKGAWTLPDDYLTAGAKKDDGSDSDLLLMVDNFTTGYDTTPTEGLAVLGAYSAYTAIALAGSDILGGGSAGTPNEGHGVEGAVCDINAKILMDWATDIVGAYSITTTLTITEVP